ncbi:hypothetical protein D915_004217 [Fasciola hepatica]|uniref:Uncharacterized protein n=1 Tax=Fasciola hepatica TaxID=6192 RepID=A0A4E0REB8_FASHE|nr:hypothetical protein D915_004217 [Fasciola hepatica]
MTNPIRLSHPAKDLLMTRLVKQWQTRKLQTDLTQLRQKWNQIDRQVPAFLVYVQQLAALLEEDYKGRTGKLYALCTQGIRSFPEVGQFHEELCERIGHPLDPKGRHCLMIQQILEVKNDLREVIASIRFDLLHPLFQIRPGCENARQTEIKERICSTFGQISGALNEIGPLEVAALEIPTKWALCIRTEQRKLFGMMLGFSLAAIEQLSNLDHWIDDYFQMGDINHLVNLSPNN